MDGLSAGLRVFGDCGPPRGANPQAEIPGRFRSGPASLAEVYAMIPSAVIAVRPPRGAPPAEFSEYSWGDRAKSAGRLWQASTASRVHGCRSAARFKHGVSHGVLEKLAKK